MNPLYEYDHALIQQVGSICGVDEAGRGPLAGPVCVAAVILGDSPVLEKLNDSKKLSEKVREELYPQIIETAVSYHIVLVGPEVIDEINILQATMKGMREAVEGLSVQPALALIDGNRCPPLHLPARSVVKGDATSAAIAAASVLAKVTRDRYMVELAKQYPQYGFEQHKGYPTKLHYERIAQYGIQSFYRKSFLKKRGIV